jgi:hypothetical protein
VLTSTAGYVGAQTSASYKTGERQGEFSFSRVFGPGVDQTSLYNAIMAPVVADAIHGGRSALVFSYGMQLGPTNILGVLDYVFIAQV